MSLPESWHKADLQVPLPGDRILSLRKDEQRKFSANAQAQGLMFPDCPRKWLLNNSVCQSWAETASRLDAYKRSSRLFGYISAHRFLAGFR